METIDNKSEVLRSQHWPKLGCINHDCEQCQAQRQRSVKPLTDEEIVTVAKFIDIEFKDEGYEQQLDDILTFARAIEAAHGIK